MKKSLVITYGTLILLTWTTALISASNAISEITFFLIMGISAIKFLMVAFQFMELKKANPFWKTSLSIALALIILLIVFVG
ncbi:cytochrome C oxidase subunit IV family protein [Flavobacterium psychrotolerans]|uniref:Cytochrome C oxidase subunit IV n=1 Tax=Flavobacterium psychrotolerans TaxID=2169410 RepID=A0A2U1JQB0_9FLAO|nr:cytochrome C oxidase subunit IV family protein [Flavobacterium psychrotolerans]PWA07164.1 hypothetical protein DB895_00090 [Flavobacterium psychrotolerans]